MSQENFEGEKPQAMVEFLERVGVENKLPATFRSQEGKFLVSIQYLFDECWSEHFDQTKKLLKFGVNTDGWDLLVDLGDNELAILQDEMGDIDTIDITIFDLLHAKVEKD